MKKAFTGTMGFYIVGLALLIVAAIIFAPFVVREAPKLMDILQPKIDDVGTGLPCEHAPNIEISETDLGFNMEMDPDWPGQIIGAYRTFEFSAEETTSSCGEEMIFTWNFSDGFGSCSLENECTECLDDNCEQVRHRFNRTITSEPERFYIDLIVKGKESLLAAAKRTSVIV